MSQSTMNGTRNEGGSATVGLPSDPTRDQIQNFRNIHRLEYPEARTRQAILFAVRLRGRVGPEQ
jgi:hypothetical protein